PARRMGRGCNGGWIAEGPDAAAGAEFQRDQHEGARGGQDGADVEVVLGLGPDACGEQERLLPLHTRDESAVRAARGDRDAARRGTRERVRTTSAACGSDTARGAGLGPRGALRESGRVQQLADRGTDACRARRRPVAQGDTRSIQYVAW